MMLIEPRVIGGKYDYFYLFPGIAFSMRKTKGIAIFWLRWCLWIGMKEEGK